jgi:hypothetical protein
LTLSGTTAGSALSVRIKIEISRRLTTVDDECLEIALEIALICSLCIGFTLAVLLALSGFHLGMMASKWGALRSMSLMAAKWGALLSVYLLAFD